MALVGVAGGTVGTGEATGSGVAVGSIGIGVGDGNTTTTVGEATTCVAGERVSGGGEGSLAGPSTWLHLNPNQISTAPTATASSHPTIIRMVTTRLGWGYRSCCINNPPNTTRFRAALRLHRLSTAEWA
jgi:hypothetical protein